MTLTTISGMIVHSIKSVLPFLPNLVVITGIVLNSSPDINRFGQK